MEHRLSFSCDYLEGAHPAILQRMCETNFAQTAGYGTDEYCASAREKIRAACGAPNAEIHFLVGGTQTNATVIDAIKKFRKVKFSYTPFYRSKASEGIIIEPYFLRIFKQRWYVIGYNSKDRMVKTYSLDRVNTLTLTEEHFDDPGISVKEFFKNFFGIMTTKSEAKHVVLRADSEQAKYLRALPLHPSQRETMGDGYSDFDYHLCITYDFIQELLSKGSRIMVVAPAELKAAVVEELRKSLSNYEL